ncbi:pilus assembly protein PilP [Acidihalobacter yilgarnensis]|nr:pilus assembly protein PilP [Acidihalobacter yilgarnensis]
MSHHVDTNPGHALPENRPGRRAAKLIVTVAMAAGLAGCGHNMSDLQHWVAEQIAQPGGHVPPIPDVPPYKGYNYPGHSKDPFDSKILLQIYNAAHRANVKFNPNRPRQYLEQFPLDSLKMVGTLVDHGTTWALIQTPDGTIERVKIGNYMGQHDGKITAISSDSVKLREIVPDGFGGYKEQPASIAMGQTK